MRTRTVLLAAGAAVAGARLLKSWMNDTDGLRDAVQSQFDADAAAASSPSPSVQADRAGLAVAVPADLSREA